MSSFPIGALQVRPAPNPVEEMGQIATVGNLLKAGPIEIAQRQEALKQSQLQTQTMQMDLEQRKAINKAYQDAMSVDPQTGVPQFNQDKMISALGQGGHGSGALEVMQHLMAYAQSQATLKESQQKIDVGQRDAAGALGSALAAANYDPNFAHALNVQHLQDPTLPAETKQQLQQLEQALSSSDPVKGKQLVQQLSDQLIAQSPKYTELQTQKQQAQARVTAAQTGQQRLEAELPGGPLADVNKSALSAYMTTPKIPGESLPIDKRNAATYEAWKAKQAPLAQFNVAQAAGGGLTSTAVDQAAENYWQTGQLPPMGRGAAGLATRNQIMNRAAQLHPEGSLAGNKAAYAANKQSLGQLQTLTDKVESFENTALKNLDLFLDKAGKIPDLGVRFANIPLRQITGKMIGDTNQRQLTAALETARTEVARVLSSATAAGAVTVDEQKRIEEMLSGNDTLQAMKGIVGVLKQDMLNRRTSYQQQLQDIRNRLGGGQPSPAGAPGAPAGYDPTKPITVTLPNRGKITIE